MIKKSVSLCLSLVLLIGVVFCCPISASASSTIVAPSTVAYIYSNTSKVETSISLGIDYGTKITNLKCSSSKIKLKPSYGGVSYANIVATSTSFTGTANISFKYKGKTYSTKYTVTKYTNPCKLFQIGPTRYTSRYNNKNTLWSKVTKENQNLKIVAKSGWKITKVRIDHENSKSSVISTDFYYPYKSTFNTKVTLYSHGHCGNYSNNYIKVTYKQNSTGKIIEQLFCL